MTNVPDNIREAWKDIYILFDTHYGMDGSNPDAWADFSKKAAEIYMRHKDAVDLAGAINAVSDMLLAIYKGQVENKTLEWKADEPYPYPAAEKELKFL